MKTLIAGAAILFFLTPIQASEPASPPAATLPSVVEKQLVAASGSQADLGISAHEPVYFSGGMNPGGEGPYNAKFQFSLKYRVINPDEDNRLHWWEQLYFGYTQTSIWDLQSESKPFRDSSYRPTLFYENPKVTRFPAFSGLLGVRAGIEHESNGKDLPDSRSINIAFIRPTFTLPATRKRGYIWSIAPKVYTYLEKSENEDIADYRGYMDLQIKLRHAESWEYLTTLRKGMQGTKGSIQVDATYPFRGLLSNVNGFFHVQYFNGHGESILDYNVKQPSQIRIGLVVVR
ncbi:MAG: phospholipase A [Moraxellaceae bacterium]|nr:phospholipase A [Moraxellaceae bacterium]